MANISTTIELYDRVSRPITKMLSALDNLTSAFESIETSMGDSFDTSKIESARRATEQAALELVKLGDETDDNTNSQKKHNKALREGEGAADGLLGKIGGMVAAYATLQGVTKVLSLSDQMTQTTARLGQLVEGEEELAKLQEQIYNAAQRSRGSYQETADAVGKLGLNAGDAFNSTDEMVAFAEQLNKQFVIAGTETAAMEGATRQLVQALGSGTLRGDELNSIFEAAPPIVQTIADYLNVPIGQIRNMAGEGLITAEIVKNAMLSAAEETNAKFEQMPLTWGQAWTMMKNKALMAFQPILTKISELMNNEDFQTFVSGVVNALTMVADVVLWVFDKIAMVAGFIRDNWSIIEPIIWGVVAALVVYNATMGIGWLTTLKNTAALVAKTVADWAETAAIFAMIWAQEGLNAALHACPLTWIIIMIIALIAIIYSVCAAIAKFTGVATSGFGVICGGVNVVIHWFKNLGLWVANVALGIGNAIDAVASNMMTAFNNAICSIQSWWYGLLSTAMEVVAGICKALNKLPFVEFDYSGISSKADEYARKSEAAANGKQEYKSIGDAFNKGYNTFDTFEKGWASDAFAAGAAWGDSVADKVSNWFGGSGSGGGNGNGENIFDPNAYSDDISGYDASQIPSNIADTAENTGRTADALEITSEDLKYLRDIAERDVINRFTTAEIKVEMTNNNSISSEMDLDGIIGYLADGINEAMEKAAEGVHV